MHLTDVKWQRYGFGYRKQITLTAARKQIRCVATIPGIPVSGRYPAIITLDGETIDSNTTCTSTAQAIKWASIAFARAVLDYCRQSEFPQPITIEQPAELIPA
jgi:hypothetical protein